ncbi:DUF4199 domain-containing protein [Pontibacter sp. Tf4]|uniref:DUF4199 domain-containing protein n=1 Tax=Pontibacter sp. Tf4 TaxID=2761620 RepID=UPI00162AAAE3|nr:DUF4199 domain-containing protein [Pontibacter sp. Tf4]MBB6610099.1 DUF4199 domain-containing protein [Pontibacter sp. Tf4]
MEKLSLKYGVLTALGLIGYFLLMRLIGLSHILELRFFNAIVLAIGIVLVLRAYKRMMHGHIGYLKGLATAFLTSLVATLLFSVFMLVYIKGFDDSLLRVISEDQMLGERIATTPGIVIFMVLMMEGVISGAMIGFIAMQFFKRQDHAIPGNL